MLNQGDEVGEYTWTQASCDVDFFSFCMHIWTENDVHRLYASFSWQMPFFWEKMFCNFWSPTSVNPYIEGDLIAPPFLPLINKFLLAGWPDQPGLEFDVILTLI